MDFYWNKETTEKAMKNFVIYAKTKETRKKAIQDMCEKINKYIPCYNKKQIIEEFKKEGEKIENIRDFNNITTNLLVNINNNWITN